MGGEQCKLKIILDSGSAAGYAQAVCDATKLVADKILTDAVAYPIINELIVAERALDKAHNLLLDAVGYDGPRP